MKHLLPLLSMLVLVPAAPAQSVVPFQGDQHWTSWPTAFSDPGAFRRAVMGQLTPEGVLDVAQLDGSELFLLANPDEFFAASRVVAPVTDMDRLAGLGAAGLDALATVSSAGLRRVWYDPASATFASSSIESSAWAGARSVRAADVNADGYADLIGIGADGQSVLQQIASAPGTSFGAGASFSAQATVRSLVVLQWDTDGALEVALLTDLSVEVHDLDGTLLNNFAAATPGGTFCAIGQSSTPRERLVWITEYAPPALQYLMVLTPAGVADIVDLGALDAFAVVPTDSDLDGDDDILISHKFSYELLWIQNERTPQDPNGASFTAAGTRKVFQVANPGPAPQNEAWPAVGDLDGDGDDDVAFANQGELRFNVYRGEAVNQGARRASVLSGSYTLGAQSEGTLNLTLGAPATIPAGATHLEVRVWRRPSYGAALDLDVLEVQSIALPASWPLVVSLELPETGGDFDDNYEVHARLVQRNTAGAVTAAYPSLVGTFGMLLADRNAAALDQPAAAATDVTVFFALEPESLPFFTSVRRFKLPPPPPITPSWANVPNFG